ncbi:MAG: hypothetical protein J6A25_10385 [Lachnospiraceae bacterium]|nr:hypothetical protein [Lachnospiraceae bacterium]
MKKIFSIVTLCVLAGTMAACDHNGSQHNETTENVSEGDGYSEEGMNVDDIETEVPDIGTVDVPDFNVDVNVDEVVLLEEKGIVVKVTGITYDDYYAQLHFSIENNSEDTYIVSSGYLGKESVSINGCMISSGYMDVTVTPGQTAEDVMEFSISEMQSKGIFEIYEVSLGFGLMIDGDYNNVDRYWPYYVRTSSTIEENTTTYKEVIENGIYGTLNECVLLDLKQDVLYSQNGVSIVSEALVIDEHDNISLLLELESKSDDNYIVYIDNVYINGVLVCDSGFSKDSINPGAMNVVEMELHRYIGEDSEYGISELNNVSFEVQLRDDSHEEVVENIKIEFPIDY